MDCAGLERRGEERRAAAGALLRQLAASPSGYGKCSSCHKQSAILSGCEKREKRTKTEMKDDKARDVRQCGMLNKVNITEVILHVFHTVGAFSVPLIWEARMTKLWPRFTPNFS